MGRLFAAVASAAFLLVLVGSAAGSAAPPGATARCVDGTYSFSQHRPGTCSHHGGVVAWLDGAATPAGGVGVGRTVLLAPRLRTAGCHRGVVPDRRCSPGAYATGLTRSVLCSPAFRTSQVRRVPQSEKFAVEQEYGMRAGFYGQTIEIDHIVPLELGGSNAIANLFPEPGSGSASYHEKDRLENRLHLLVCAGRIGLRAAQVGIATDWRALVARVVSG